MRIVDRYIARAIWINIVMALVVLGGMDTLFAFIAELEDLTATYRPLDAAIFALATFPRRCYEFIAVSSLMGTLLALGAMASSSELTVMRAAGISLTRIIIAALIPVTIFALIALMLGQFVIPPAEQYGRAHRAAQQGDGTMLRVKQGNWHRDGNDVIHISAIERNGTLHGVKRFTFAEDGTLQAMSQAQRAQRVDNAWVLENNSATQLGSDGVLVREKSSIPWSSQLTPAMIELVISRPEFLSISRLYAYAVFLNQQGLDNRSYALAFWKKMLQPVATGIMVLLAVSFIFGPLRSVTVGLRIMVGLIVGLLFHYLQDFMVHASTVFNVPPWVATLLPIGVFLGVGILLLRRVR